MIRRHAPCHGPRWFLCQYEFLGEYRNKLTALTGGLPHPTDSTDHNDKYHKRYLHVSFDEKAVGKDTRTGVVY
jgi:hypothetical protein